MRKNAKLVLNRETVRTLDEYALTRVVGGSLRVCRDYDISDPPISIEVSCREFCGPGANTFGEQGCQGQDHTNFCQA